MKWSSPRPAGGGKPFPKFSHPPWPCLGSGWSWTSIPVPWSLTHSVTWVWRRKNSASPLQPPPSPNTVWDLFRHHETGINSSPCPVQPVSPRPCWGHGNACLLLEWAESETGMPSLFRAPRDAFGRWGSQGLPEPVLPGHGSGEVPSPCRAKAWPGAPESSLGIWGFLQAHLWCWHLTEHMQQVNRVHLCLLKARSPADWV